MKRLLFFTLAVILFTAFLCIAGLIICSQPARVHIYDIGHPIGIR